MAGCTAVGGIACAMANAMAMIAACMIRQDPAIVFPFTPDRPSEALATGEIEPSPPHVPPPDIA